MVGIFNTWLARPPCIKNPAVNILDVIEAFGLNHSKHTETYLGRVPETYLNIPGGCSRNIPRHSWGRFQKQHIETLRGRFHKIPPRIGKMFQKHIGTFLGYPSITQYRIFLVVLLLVLELCDKIWGPWGASGGVLGAS